MLTHRHRVAAAVLVLITTTGCARLDDVAMPPPPAPGGATEPTAGLPPLPEPAGTLAPDASLDALDVLPRREVGERGDYDRDAFGQSWKDVENNGCGQRDDILTRDLAEPAVRLGSACVIVSGTLTDPWSGEVVLFAKAEASEVQVDHALPLREMWDAGAWAWTEDDRELAANDLGNLVASSAGANSAKSDHTAEDWQPTRADAGCLYSRMVVTIRDRYTLALTEPEALVLDELLQTC